MTPLLLTAMMLFQGSVQSPRDFEQFRVELTADYWRLNPAGNVKTDATHVDLRSDLGVRGQKGHGLIKLAAKPGRKHRILFAAIPYRLKGNSTITRTFEFGGKIYPVQDVISSDSEINHFFAGYQYDFVSRRQGHVGVMVGVGYFDGKATVSSQRFGSSAEDGSAPLPLAGIEFRGFPIPGKNALNINGEVKGMSLGSYGRYIESDMNLGFGLGRHFTLQVGANLVDLDVHKKDLSEGFKLRFIGPTVSIQLRDR